MSDIDYKNLFNMQGKTVLITGGVGILGKEFCRGFLAHGASVVIADCDKDAISTALSELDATENTDNVMAAVCDVADPVSVAGMIEQSVERFGSIDVLINNAAGKSSDLKKFFAPFEDYDLNTWRKITSVNLDGMFLVSQAVGKQMLRQKSGGSIIQVSSIYGVMAPDNRIYEGSKYLGHKINSPAVYAASKAGVIGLAKYMATYWAEQGIRVNALAPGGVESGQNETFNKRYSDRVPMGRMADRHEMVGTAIYLASDAASYVTGQTIVVDGGLDAW